MELSQEDRATIRSAARWAAALIVVLGLNMVSSISHIADGSLRDGLLMAALILITGWQMLALGLSAFAFSSRPTAERFESGLYGLRTFAKIGVLALPLLAIAAGSTCELSVNNSGTKTSQRGAR